MMTKHRILAAGHATSLFLLLSYVLCIGFGWLLPDLRMVEAWAPLLPGFEWFTPQGLVFGLVGSYLWGWYIAVVWVPLHDLFRARYGSGNDA